MSKSIVYKVCNICSVGKFKNIAMYIGLDPHKHKGRIGLLLKLSTPQSRAANKLHVITFSEVKDKNEFNMVLETRITS